MLASAFVARWCVGSRVEVAGGVFQVPEGRADPIRGGPRVRIHLPPARSQQQTVLDKQHRPASRPVDTVCLPVTSAQYAFHAKFRAGSRPARRSEPVRRLGVGTIISFHSTPIPEATKGAR
jgi:hypothetical protein